MSSGRWDDLTTRVVTGIVLAAITLTAIWAGGAAVVLLCAVAAGLMIWELSGLVDPGNTVLRNLGGALAALTIVAFSYAPGFMALGLFLCVPGLAAGLPPGRRRWIFAGYGALVLLGAMGVVSVRTGPGLAPVLWLIGIVIAADIGGYFGGKLFGGARFWPRLSPKKTWSGTISGWVLAALTGLILGSPSMPVVGLALLSAFLAFVGQMGDIAESAVKRHVGVKDASALLPGHGGLLDRFDSMIAVFALALAIRYTALLPGTGF